MYRHRFLGHRLAVRAFRPRIEYLETRTLPSAATAMVMPFLQATADGLTGGPPSSALTPAQFRNAYGLGAIRFSTGSSSVIGDGRGQTVAIVDAYDDPMIASDLAAFDAHFGLSAPASFVKIDQRGNQITGSSNINPNQAWAMETALDVEWAHSVAPAAGIVLVEADSSSWNDINAAIRTAANYPGVGVVSMSFGISENDFNPVAAGFDAAFAQPLGHNPVSFVAAAGDDGATLGYGTAPSFPATSPYVLAVGGTTLNLTSASQYVSETAWAGTTAGKSLYEAEPTFQASVQNSGNRQVPDVSLDADPSTGVAVLNTFSHSRGNGWFQVGGTSLAAPAWAAFLTIADQGRVLNNLPTLGQAQADVYAVSRSDFNVVRSASNPLASPTKTLDPQTGLGTIRGNALANALATIVESTNLRLPHITTVVVRPSTTANPFLLVVLNSPVLPLPQPITSVGTSMAIPAAFVQAGPVASADFPGTPSLPAPTPILLAHSTVDIAPPADTAPAAAVPEIMDAEPDDLPDLVPDKDNAAPPISGQLEARDACFVKTPVAVASTSGHMQILAPASDVMPLEPWHLAGVAVLFTGAYTRAERDGQERKIRHTAV